MTPKLLGRPHFGEYRGAEKDQRGKLDWLNQGKRPFAGQTSALAQQLLNSSSLNKALQQEGVVSGRVAAFSKSFTTQQRPNACQQSVLFSPEEQTSGSQRQKNQSEILQPEMTQALAENIAESYGAKIEKNQISGPHKQVEFKTVVNRAHTRFRSEPQSRCASSLGSALEDRVEAWPERNEQTVCEELKSKTSKTDQSMQEGQLQFIAKKQGQKCARIVQMQIEFPKDSESLNQSLRILDQQQLQNENYLQVQKRKIKKLKTQSKQSDLTFTAVADAGPITNFSRTLNLRKQGALSPSSRYIESRQSFWRQKTQAQFAEQLAELQQKLKMQNTSTNYLDFEAFEADIAKRKDVRNQLNQQAEHIQGYLTGMQAQQMNAVQRLSNYTERYTLLVLDNILLIQRWWRGFRHRMFFKTLLSQDINRWKRKHQQEVLEMESSVKKGEERMLKRIAELKEQSNRDANAELLEQKKREMYQLKKSEAVTKFEIVLSTALQSALQNGVIQTLRAVKEPMFNKELNVENLDEFSSYWLGTKTDASGTNKAAKRIQFAPTLADRVSKNAANKYNTGAQTLQEIKTQIKKQTEKERFQRIKTISKKPLKSKNKVADLGSVIHRFSTLSDPSEPLSTLIATDLATVEICDVDESSGQSTREELKTDEKLQPQVFKKQKNKKNGIVDSPPLQVSSRQTRRTFEMRQSLPLSSKKSQLKSGTFRSAIRQTLTHTTPQICVLKLRKETNSIERKFRGLDPISETSMSQLASHLNSNKSMVTNMLTTDRELPRRKSEAHKLTQDSSGSARSIANIMLNRVSFSRKYKQCEISVGVNKISKEITSSFRKISTRFNPRRAPSRQSSGTDDKTQPSLGRKSMARAGAKGVKAVAQIAGKSMLLSRQRTRLVGKKPQGKAVNELPGGGSQSKQMAAAPCQDNKPRLFRAKTIVNTKTASPGFITFTRKFTILKKAGQSREESKAGKTDRSSVGKQASTELDLRSSETLRTSSFVVKESLHDQDSLRPTKFKIKSASKAHDSIKVKKEAVAAKKEEKIKDESGQDSAKKKAEVESESSFVTSEEFKDHDATLEDYQLLKEMANSSKSIMKSNRSLLMKTLEGTSGSRGVSEDARNVRWRAENNLFHDMRRKKRPMSPQTEESQEESTSQYNQAPYLQSLSVSPGPIISSTMERAPNIKVPISPEQTAYIKGLVDKSLSTEGGFSGLMTVPFKNAYQELDEIHKLFNRHISSKNVLVVAAREQIKQRIKAKYADKQPKIQQVVLPPKTRPSKKQKRQPELIVEKLHSSFKISNGTPPTVKQSGTVNVRGTQTLSEILLTSELSLSSNQKSGSSNSVSDSSCGASPRRVNFKIIGSKHPDAAAIERFRQKSEKSLSETFVYPVSKRSSALVRPMVRKPTRKLMSSKSVFAQGPQDDTNSSVSAQVMRQMAGQMFKAIQDSHNNIHDSKIGNPESMAGRSNSIVSRTVIMKPKNSQQTMPKAKISQQMLSKPPLLNTQLDTGRSPYGSKKSLAYKSGNSTTPLARRNNALRKAPRLKASSKSMVTKTKN